MLLNPTRIVVHHKQILLVRVADAVLEFATLDRGGEVDFARRQPPQHDRRYREIDSVPDVRFPVLIGTPTVEDHQCFRIAPQQAEQTLLADKVAFTLGRHGHLLRHALRHHQHNNNNKTKEERAQPPTVKVHLRMMIPLLPFRLMRGRAGENRQEATAVIGWMGGVTSFH